MVILGKLYAESPIYRGNARKTLFTRDGDGTQRLVSLAGEIAGTAQSLMDAFLGKSGNNLGLINKMWLRLYKSHLPSDLITSIKCNLREESYPRERFFDIRMGLRLDEDRWAAESNANYKMETLYRNSVFDIEMTIRDSVLKKDNNESRLFYVLQEIKAGRFWFGAGKSKGLGRCRLEIDLPFSPDETLENINSNANHLTLSIMFKAKNPVLVGWNWGKVSAEIPSFAAVDGRSLVDSMRNLTSPIRDRLGTVLGGPILTPEDWKKKLASYFPRVIAIWLRERSMARTESWIIPSSALPKLTKGKFPLSPKLVDRLKLMADQPYPSLAEAEKGINDALGKKANMTKRVLEILEHKSFTGQKFDDSAWLEIVNSIGLDPSLRDSVAAQIQNESGMLEILEPACKPILPGLFQQVDRQVRIIESDPWVDMELNIREDHIRIKTLLLKGRIDETQWNNTDQPPEGVSASSWREFLQAHRNVQFRHLLNSRNLQKSIVNDNNFIEFLETYRDSVRQELSQSYNTDYRQGGPSNREISKKYGKPYDNVFMRMLTWAPSSQEQGTWEIYVPGSTIKGAFRKRASQILKTLWGENERTEKLLDRLF
ncbi:hypothetical protein FJZ33_09135, partial [Candidatus Poribacteria bacterium]|nr:hypothetical protein [Candidatus Poribacteria bacterium]